MKNEAIEGLIDETKKRANELKPCCTCVFSNEPCTWCFENKIPIHKAKYGCAKHINNDELIRKQTEEQYKKSLATQQRLLLELDIMSYEIGAAQQTLEKLDAELQASYSKIEKPDRETEINHKESKQRRAKLGKAFAQLKAYAQDMRNTYNKYVEYYFDTLFGDENGKYDWKESDKYLSNMGVINQFVRVLVDRTLENGENADAIMNFMLSLKGSGIYDSRQVGKFKIRK